MSAEDFVNRVVCKCSSSKVVLRGSGRAVVPDQVVNRTGPAATVRGMSGGRPLRL